MCGWEGGWGVTGPLVVQSREGHALEAFGLQGRAGWGLLSAQSGRRTRGSPGLA